MFRSLNFKSEMQSSATLIVFVSLLCVASSCFYGYGFYEEVSHNTQLLESLQDTAGELSESDIRVVEELKIRLAYSRLGYTICAASVLIFSYLVVSNFSDAISEIKFFFISSDVAAPKALANAAETLVHVTPQAASYFSNFPAGTLSKVDMLISVYEGSYATPEGKSALLELYPKIFGNFSANAFSSLTSSQADGAKIKIVYSFVQSCQVVDPADYLKHMSTSSNISTSMKTATRFILAFYNSVKA